MSWRVKLGLTAAALNALIALILASFHGPWCFVFTFAAGLNLVLAKILDSLEKEIGE